MENVFGDVLVERISRARLSSFLRETGGDVTTAIRLYEWNAHLSASVFELLGHVEVVIRNAMHQELAHWNSEKFGNSNWFDNHHGLLMPKAMSDIAVANERLKRRNRERTGDRIVSELNFGFWRFLLTKQYKTTLWPTALKNAFPNLESGGMESLGARLASLHGLRNRIAHHEPIHQRKLDKDISDCGLVIRSVCEQTEIWALMRSKAQEILEIRPLS